MRGKVGSDKAISKIGFLTLFFYMIDSVNGHQGKQGACSGKWVFQGADGGAEREKVETGKDGEAEENFSLTLVSSLGRNAVDKLIMQYSHKLSV